MDSWERLHEVAFWHLVLATVMAVILTWPR
jgi:hypothetical protein